MLDKQKCSHTRHTGPVNSETMSGAMKDPPVLRSAKDALLKRVKKRVKKDANVVIRLEGGAWFLGKACRKIYTLDSKNEPHKKVCSALGIKAGTEVVELLEYSESNSSESSGGKSYHLCTAKCSEWLWDCGPQPPKKKPAGWQPCLKQHRSVYRTRDIREPVGFVLSTERKRLRRSTSASAGSTLKYMLAPGTLQDIENNKTPQVTAAQQRRRRAQQAARG